MADYKRKTPLLNDNPLCGRSGTYKDTLNLANGDCTRKIGKVVFKGTEKWYDVSTNGVYYTNVVKDLANKNNYSPMCSHFKLIPQTTIANITDGSFTSDNNVFFWFKESSITSLADWITYLQQQYAAGTPVTVWYVLATPTTETITVPSGLTGTEEGYLNRSGTPTPTNPIYPTANNVEVWFHSLRKLGTATDTLTNLPAVLYPNDTTATVGLKGNMSQTGTPTHDNPIMPQGTGERTGNLAPPLTEWVDGYVSGSGAIAPPSENYKEKSSDYIPVKVGREYTFSVGNEFPGGTNYPWRAIGWYTQNKTFISRASGIAGGALSTSAPSNAVYCRLSFRTHGETTNPMLNTGSEALPYEPYGIKIPISSANTTTPVYLGEVETTRKVKKLVLTGEEAWQLWNGNYYASIIDRKGAIGTILCTHFINSSSQGISYNNQSTSGLKIASVAVPFVSDLSGLKEWLAAQYAAGTPVTVWYVLATPTTGIVNEPLRKIGVYADSVSVTGIPTTTGKDSFDVLTTLKPSEVSLSYTGWHDAQCKEYDDSQWV